MNIPEKWAYPAVMIGVAGHASSEFFAKLGGVAGPETSVWRYLLGGFGLILWALWDRDSRDLITPLRREGLNILWLSGMGVTVTYLFFHWALDYATVIQVATVTTTIPIFVGLANWVLNGVRPGPVKMVTGALAVLGIAVLLTDGALAALAGDAGELPGILLATGCAALGLVLRGSGPAGDGAAWRAQDHRADDDDRRHRPVAAGRHRLGDLGEPRDHRRETGAGGVVADHAGAHEHHGDAAHVVRRAVGGAGHHPRVLPVLSQADHRGIAGHRDPRRLAHGAAGAGDRPRHRLRPGRALLAASARTLARDERAGCSRHPRPLVNPAAPRDETAWTRCCFPSVTAIRRRRWRGSCCRRAGA